MSRALVLGVLALGACKDELCGPEAPDGGRADNGLVYDGAEPGAASAPYKCEIRKGGVTLVTMSVPAWSPEGAVAEVHRRHPWSVRYEVVCGSPFGPSCDSEPARPAPSTPPPEQPPQIPPPRDGDLT